MIKKQEEILEYIKENYNSSEQFRNYIDSLLKINRKFRTEIIKLIREQQAEKENSFGKSILDEAINSYHWWRSKVRVAQQPAMSMSLSKRIIRDARNFEVITQEKYEEILKWE